VNPGYYDANPVASTVPALKQAPAAVKQAVSVATDAPKPAAQVQPAKQAKQIVIASASNAFAVDPSGATGEKH
jgi:hypothetical protein